MKIKARKFAFLIKSIRQNLDSSASDAVKPPMELATPKRKKKLHHQQAVVASASLHNDILRFYVVHREYANLLESDTLARLYDYTNEMMRVRMEYDGEEWTLEDFCKKLPTEPVRIN